MENVVFFRHFFLKHCFGGLFIPQNAKWLSGTRFLQETTTFLNRWSLKILQNKMGGWRKSWQRKRLSMIKLKKQPCGDKPKAEEKYADFQCGVKLHLYKVQNLWSLILVKKTRYETPGNKNLHAGALKFQYLLLICSGWCVCWGWKNCFPVKKLV